MKVEDDEVIQTEPEAIRTSQENENKAEQVEPLILRLSKRGQPKKNSKDKSKRKSRRSVGKEQE